MKKNKQPHDAFFKQSFSHRQVVLDYLKNFVSPDLLKHFDLRTLQRTFESYLDEEWDKFFSDIVYSIDWKKGKVKKGETKVYLLMEHKSYPPKYIHVQLLKYMVETWMDDIKNKCSLTFVIPMVIYHGKRNWKYQSFSNFFNYPSEAFKNFIPNFDYLLTDLKGIEDEELLALKAGFLINTFIAFKHSGDKEYLKEHTLRIFHGAFDYLKTEHGKNLLKLLNVYMSKSTSFEEHEVEEIFNNLPEPLKEFAMSTYEMYVKKGREIEREQAFEKMKLAVCKFMKKYSAVPNEEIAEIFALDIKTLKEIRVSLKQ